MLPVRDHLHTLGGGRPSGGRSSRTCSYANLAHLAGNMLYGSSATTSRTLSATFATRSSISRAASPRALTETAVMPHSGVAMLGASGAISGVLAAYGVRLLRLMQKREPVEYDLWECLGLRTRRA